MLLSHPDYLNHDLSLPVLHSLDYGVGPVMDSLAPSETSRGSGPLACRGDSYCAESSSSRLSHIEGPTMAGQCRVSDRFRHDAQRLFMSLFRMESLRVLPPVPMTIRKAKEGDWVDGVYIPKGTLLYIPVCLTSI